MAGEVRKSRVTFCQRHLDSRINCSRTVTNYACCEFSIYFENRGTQAVAFLLKFRIRGLKRERISEPVGTAFGGIIIWG